MQPVRVEFVREQVLVLADFFRAGDSFRICQRAHRWPPLATLHAFLQCGVNDHGNDTMRWTPFAVSPAEYDAARIEVDAAGDVDDLGTVPGDWRGWFARAVDILRSGD